jgi:hypothetical protein
MSFVNSGLGSGKAIKVAEMREMRNGFAFRAGGNLSQGNVRQRNGEKGDFPMSALMVINRGFRGFRGCTWIKRKKRRDAKNAE